jgi:hypothetical protein
MTGSKNGLAAATIAAVLALSLAGEHASALSAELANKCRAMAIETYPPKRAGGATINARAQRDYFKMCVSKNGNVDNEGAQKEAPARPK